MKMTITFKSESCTSVEMNGRNARELLEMLGKNSAEDKGVFAPIQLAEAIATLSDLIEARADRRKIQAKAEIDHVAGDEFQVDISLRAMPLLELFESAQEIGKPVSWGI